MELAQKLKKIRTRKNLSQKEVALSVGIDRGQYSRFETGKAEPSLPTLRKIALALQVRVADLFSEDQGYDISSYEQSLVEKVRLLDQLDPKQKELIFGMIDTVLVNQKLKTKLSHILDEVA